MRSIFEHLRGGAALVQKQQRSEPALHAPQRRMFNNADTKKNQKQATRQTSKVSALFLTPEPRQQRDSGQSPFFVPLNLRRDAVPDSIIRLSVGIINNI